MKVQSLEHLSPSLLVVVQGLENLAIQNFPVFEVGNFFQNILIPFDDLKPYAFFENERYTRNLIYKTPAFELMLLCWSPAQESPIHGHEGEKCWMRIQQGQLVFTNYQEVAPAQLEQVSVVSGNVGFTDGPAIIHKVENVSSEPAISLHLYARPFAQCDVFDQEHHEKKKVQLSYYSVYGQLVSG